MLNMIEQDKPNKEFRSLMLSEIETLEKAEKLKELAATFDVSPIQEYLLRLAGLHEFFPQRYQDTILIDISSEEVLRRAFKYEGVPVAVRFMDWSSTMLTLYTQINNILLKPKPKQRKRPTSIKTI